VSAPGDAAAQPARLVALLRAMAGVLVLLCLFAVIVCFDPNFLHPGSLMAFVKRSTPLMILAMGQLFVIVSGGLDLSVGAIVSFGVLSSALLLNGDAAGTWWVVPLVLVLGAALGTVNGLVVSRLRVPSIIATLGMMISINGAGLYWSGGSARGYLPDAFRVLGRGNLPAIGPISGVPVAMLVLLAVVLGASWLMHRASFGKMLLAVGDNARAAELAGVPVNRVRTLAFMLSGLSAGIAGVLLGGFSGPSTGVGAGLEMQAISATVIGGAQMVGGRGSVAMALAGSLMLQALFTLLNLIGLPKPLRDAVQGAILIAAVAYSALREARTR
jgi:ribose transport system permease protein